MKALVKKDIGNLKEGTILEFTSGVFAYQGTTFLPEDVLSDQAHFEIVEFAPVFKNVLIDSEEYKTKVHTPTIDFSYEGPDL